MKRAAIYVKAENRRNDYMSLLEFIKEHGEWSYVGNFKDLYGNDPTEYDSLIEKALNGDIDIIVTDTVARFGHNKKEFTSNMKLLMEHKVVVYYLKEQISSDDPHFPDVLGVISAFLEDQKELRAERRKK